jgi:hypothetical protein
MKSSTAGILLRRTLNGLVLLMPVKDNLVASHSVNGAAMALKNDL